MKQTFIVSQSSSLNHKRQRMESTEISSEKDGSNRKVNSIGNARVLLYCNCKNSNCLKLYCECFSRGLVCDKNTCACKNCFNNEENKNIRQESITKYLKKEMSYYRKNIENLFKGKVSDFEMGCTCKKSNCNKNYCECFNKKKPCTTKCKCMGCKNSECSTKTNSLINNLDLGLEIKNYKTTRIKIIINNYEILEN